MPKSAYLRDALLAWVKEEGFEPELLNGLNISLHTDDPGLDGANEYAGAGNYNRAGGVVFVDGDNPGEVKNDEDVLFLTVTEDYEADLTHFGVWDQGGTGGNFLGGSPLYEPRTLTAGMSPRFPAGSLIWTEI